MRNLIKSNSSSVLYVLSGLFKTFIQVIIGFVILRWIDPGPLGFWQSLILFSTYIHILTLGTTSALNREVPFLLGQNKKEEALSIVSSIGFFTSVISWGLMVLAIIGAIVLVFFEVYSLEICVQMALAVFIGSLSIQTNFIGATFRTSENFSKVAKVQFLVAFSHLMLLPVIYYWGINGYISYQVLTNLFLFVGYYYFRPFKISNEWNWVLLKKMVKEGFHLYVWNYLSTISKSLPRLVLALFSTPLSVGLFAPAQNVNTAILNLPGLLNRIIFPKLSFKFGESGNADAVIETTQKWAKYLLAIMSCLALVLTIIIPYVFNQFFPKYIASQWVCIMILWAGVLFSVNSVFQLAVTSIKQHSYLHQQIVFRFINFGICTLLIYPLVMVWLETVAIAALISEALNFIHWLLIFRKLKK